MIIKHYWLILSEKRSIAVQSIIDEIGLSDRVRAEKLRAEEIPNTYKQKFDFVTFRAVAKANILLEYAEPFLAPQGTLIVMKANVDEIELQDASQAAKIFGYENVHVKHLSYQTILAIEKFFYTKKLRRAKSNYREKLEWLNRIRLLQEEGNCGMFT